MKDEAEIWASLGAKRREVRRFALLTDRQWTVLQARLDGATLAQAGGLIGISGSGAYSLMLSAAQTLIGPTNPSGRRDFLQALFAANRTPDELELDEPPAPVPIL